MIDKILIQMICLKQVIQQRKKKQYRVRQTKNKIAIRANHILLLVIVTILIQISCDHKKECFHFPNGEVLCNKMVRDLKDDYKVHFVDYYGFMGAYNDSILNEFLIKFNDDRHVFQRNVSKEDIQKLENNKISEIRFEKIIDKDINIDILSKYILKNYSGAQILIENKNTYYIMFNNQKIVKIEQNFTGLSGLFVTLLPVKSQ